MLSRGALPQAPLQPPCHRSKPAKSADPSRHSFATHRGNNALKRFSKAPVSEVIFGVTFTTSRLGLQTLLRAPQVLASRYPGVEVRAPLVDDVLTDYQLHTDLDAEKTGPFLLRLRSEDRKWLCQLQGNKIYVNWLRLDTEPVGEYAGYSAVFSAFRAVLKELDAPLESLTAENVRCFDLTYHDRVEWQKHIDSISAASKLMRFTPPQISTPSGFNNVFSRFTYHHPELGGYGIVAMNTQTSPEGVQVLRFENTIRGVSPELSANEWFDAAHDLQYEHFTQMFREETLSAWT